MTKSQLKRIIIQELRKLKKIGSKLHESQNMCKCPGMSRSIECGQQSCASCCEDITFKPPSDKVSQETDPISQDSRKRKGFEKQGFCAKTRDFNSGEAELCKSSTHVGGGNFQRKPIPCSSDADCVDEGCYCDYSKGGIKEQNTTPWRNKMTKSQLKRIIIQELRSIKEDWYSQNQPTGQTGPQGQVFTPGSEITPNPAFYGKMDQLFAQRGCNGLLKRLQKFNNNMAGLVPGYNERWRSMLMMKINYMEKMIADNC